MEHIIMIDSVVSYGPCGPYAGFHCCGPYVGFHDLTNASI